MSEVDYPGDGCGVEDAELIEVADGVHAWIQPDGTWWINNAGYISGDDFGILVDTSSTELRTRAFLDAVAGVSGGKPLRYAINTHHHGDHTFGNSLLPAETVLIGHGNMRAGLLADRTLEQFPPYFSPRPHFGAVTRRLPDLTISTATELHPGGRQVHVVPVGFTAHTEGDVGIWIPDVRVLFAGDLLFPGHTPMIMAGSPSGAIRVLDWIASFGAELVVAGHGLPVAADGLPGILDQHRRYYEFVLEQARRGVADGLTQLEVAQTADLGEYGELPDPERFVLNVHSAYAELAGGSTDRAAALADAVAWLGRPIRTKA
ncbi:MBL fold metallo-hydrolase [Amycolatopsis jejuensis]|uniref:MBL fold metallo-hydrolase n=1 Tax=Amycolatopsis jejuensis TaxID=330084 RepID=UPI001FDFE1D1|nr:MBL fold metallo-hydrolase [Amycolatopsis jejuensis]